jgi:hypothetical protein
MKKILIAFILCVCLMPAAFGQLDKTWRRLTTTERMTLLQFKATDVELEKGPNNDTVFLVVNRNTGVVDTFTMDELRNCIGTPITDTSLFAVNAGLLQGKDTTDVWAYVEEHTSAGGGESYFDSTAAGMIFLKNPANKLIIGATTSSGTEKLNVYNGAVLFDGATGTTPVSGEGTRMMWIPSKAAFRAGGVSSTQWDNANIGAYSVACGLNNLAGSYSATFGAGNSGINPEYMLISGSANYPYNSRMGALIGDQNGTEYGNTSFLVAGYNNTINASYSATFGYQNKNYSYANLIAGKWCNQLGSNTWVSTDPLMQLGNGSSIANRNDALRILKNGTAYIGDASSTTDPILTVSTTDSTTTLIGILKLTPQDDPPVSASEGMIYADTDHHLYYYNGTAWVQLD